MGSGFKKLGLLAASFVFFGLFTLTAMAANQRGKICLDVGTSLMVYNVLMNTSANKQTIIHYGTRGCIFAKVGDRLEVYIFRTGPFRFRVVEEAHPDCKIQQVRDKVTPIGLHGNILTVDYFSYVVACGRKTKK